MLALVTSSLSFNSPVVTPRSAARAGPLRMAFVDSLCAADPAPRPRHERCQLMHTLLAAFTH